MKIKANRIISIFLLLIFGIQSNAVFAANISEMNAQGQLFKHADSLIASLQDNNIDDMLPPLNKVEEPTQPSDETIELNLPIKPIEKPQTSIIEPTATIPSAQPTYIEPTSANSYARPTEIKSITTITKENPTPIERIIPQGATLQVQVSNDIDTINCELGQNIEMSLIKPIEENGVTIIPQNSTVIGQITRLSKAGHGEKNAVLEIDFNNIRTPKGQLIPINAKIKTIDDTGVLRGGELDKQLSKSAGIVAVSSLSGTLTGAGIAALCGAAAVGSVIGLTIGAAMGVNWLKNQKGNEITIPTGTNLLLELTQTATLTCE